MHIRRKTKRTVKVQFRINSEVYRAVKNTTGNFSEWLRSLIYESLKADVERLSERQRLALELSKLEEEMNKLHRWDKTLRFHGSYAKASIKAVKGGIIDDRPPHYHARVKAELKPEELRLAEKSVELRERLAEIYRKKLERYLELEEEEIEKLAEHP
ncbi:MAG: hypothetical protein QXT26_02390 [Thermoproteota archaeon]